MIVDLFTRVWDTPQQLGEPMIEQLRRKRSAPWEAFEAGPKAHAQAIAPVHHAAIHGLSAPRIGAEIPTERVAELVNRDRQRYFGFAGIDPVSSPPAASLKRALSLGLSGVTVSPALAGFHPLHSRAMELYEACEAEAVPVVFESGAVACREAMMEFAQPMLLDEVLRSFPKLRVVLTGLGDPFLDQTMALLAKHPTLFGELSSILIRPWRLYNALIEAHQREVMSQLLFGSGFPHTRPDRAIVAIYSASGTAQGTNLPGVPREQLRAVVERDAFACLGLQPPRAKPALIESEAVVDAKSAPAASSAEEAESRDEAARLEEARR
ncbi:MAG: amidohydrolase family protein [Phycisphaeraceae bacterium]